MAAGTNSLGDPLWQYDYTPTGNVTAITTPGARYSYGYDAVARLTHVHRDGLQLQRYSYDRNGNRQRLWNEGGQTIYTYQPGTNRLQSRGQERYRHDAAGHRLSDGARTYGYNAAGRLYEVYEQGELKATYTYDAQGRRIAKTTAQGTTHYHYDLQGNLIAETTARGEPIREYLRLGSRPIAQRAGGILTCLHTDHLGTPRRGTDTTGAVVWVWSSAPFGATAINEDPDGNGAPTAIHLRFPGQYCDEETGFHYNYFRFYAPKIGRYITADPLGSVLFNEDEEIFELNQLYAYAANNPLTFFDQSGLNPQQCSNDTKKDGCNKNLLSRLKGAAKVVYVLWVFAHPI